MIDTHGLPMKFEFHLGNPDVKTFVVDFNRTKCGNPYLYKVGEEHDGNYSWPPETISNCVSRGSWVIMNIIEEASLCVEVEDLL